MEPTTILMAILLAAAMAFGLLTWVSKNVWRSRARTNLCALAGIGSTLGFVALALVVLP
jgi:Flp pilus assembly protein CpaB